jgi:hypothetical protein
MLRHKCPPNLRNVDFVVSFSIIVMLLICVVGCPNTNPPIELIPPPGVRSWGSSRYGGKEPFNANFYSIVNDDLASVAFYCDIGNTNVTDLELVFDCLAIVRADYGTSFKRGTITKDLQDNPYRPKNLVVIVNGGRNKIRVTAVLAFSDAFEPSLSESKVHLIKGLSWANGDGSSETSLRAYEEFVRRTSSAQESPTSKPDLHD